MGKYTADHKPLEVRCCNQAEKNHNIAVKEGKKLGAVTKREICAPFKVKREAGAGTVRTRN